MIAMWDVVCVETMWSHLTWRIVRDVITVTPGIIQSASTSSTQPSLALVVKKLIPLKMRKIYEK